jgi:hypothetical protein
VQQILCPNDTHCWFETRRALEVAEYGGALLGLAAASQVAERNYESRWNISVIGQKRLSRPYIRSLTKLARTHDRRRSFAPGSFGIVGPAPATGAGIEQS